MDSAASEQSCPRCGTPRQSYLRYCLTCSLDLEASPAPEPSAPPVREGRMPGMVAVVPRTSAIEAPSGRRGRWWLPVTALGSALPFVLIWLVVSNPLHLAMPRGPAPDAVPNWAPKGFVVESDNPLVAWRWMKDDEYECPATGVCTAVEAVARDGCPAGISGEITVTTESRVAVDTIRVESGSVIAGGHVTLVFDAGGLIDSGWAQPPVLRCR